MKKNSLICKLSVFVTILSLMLSVVYVSDHKLALAIEGTWDDVTDDSGVTYRCITDTTSADYGKAVLAGVSDESKQKLTTYDIKSKVSFDKKEYTVTEIGTSTSDAFRDCTALASITIPDTVKKIDDGAFRNCTALKSIVVPDSVEEIGEQAFLGCTALSSVTLSNKVNEIKGLTFSDCANLESVTFPSTLKTIGERAFQSCPKLSKVELKDGVTTIASGAFEPPLSTEKGTGINEITIPKSVTSIAEDAFGLSHKMTMYGYKDSYAQSYADSHDDITFVLLDGDGTSQGKVYSNAYFSITVPEKYLDKVMISATEGVGAGFGISSKLCYDESEGQMGCLCWLGAYTDDSYKEMPNYEILKKSGGQIFTREDPTDIQTEGLSDAAKAEYQELLTSGLIADLIDSMQITPPPKATSIKSIKALKRKRVRVSLKKISGVDGYEIAYSTQKSFKNYIAAGTSSAKETISHRIKGKKKYYFRARTYVFDKDDNVFYSKWSAVKKVKTKK